MTKPGLMPPPPAGPLTEQERRELEAKVAAVRRAFGLVPDEATEQLQALQNAQPTGPAH